MACLRDLVQRQSSDLELERAWNRALVDPIYRGEGPAAAPPSAAALSAALTRVMAIPKVDAWLKHVGLASAPDA